MFSQVKCFKFGFRLPLALFSWPLRWEMSFSSWSLAASLLLHPWLYSSIATMTASLADTSRFACFFGVVPFGINLAAVDPPPSHHPACVLSLPTLWVPGHSEGDVFLSSQCLLWPVAGAKKCFFVCSNWIILSSYVENVLGSMRGWTLRVFWAVTMLLTYLPSSCFIYKLLLISCLLSINSSLLFLPVFFPWVFCEASAL